MVMIVEMARGDPFREGFQDFSCHKSSWNRLLEIGRSFGWEPMGTIPDPLFSKERPDYMQFFKPDYGPDEWAYCKRLSDADAVNLAAALRRAIGSIQNGNVIVMERTAPALIKDDVSAEELQRINQPATQLLKGFARFAEGGGFAFAWDD